MSSVIILFSLFLSVWGTPSCQYVYFYGYNEIYEAGACQARARVQIDFPSAYSYKYVCNANRIISHRWDSNGNCSGPSDSTQDVTYELRHFDCNLPLCKDDANAPLVSFAKMVSCTGGDGSYGNGLYYNGTTEVLNFITNYCVPMGSNGASTMVVCDDNPYSMTYAYWFSSSTCSGNPDRLITIPGQGCIDNPPTNSGRGGYYQFQKCTNPTTFSEPTAATPVNTIIVYNWITMTIAGSLIILLCFYIIFMYHMIGKRDNSAHYASVKNIDRTSN